MSHRPPPPPPLLASGNNSLPQTLQKWRFSWPMLVKPMENKKTQSQPKKTQKMGMHASYICFAPASFVSSSKLVRTLVSKQYWGRAHEIPKSSSIDWELAKALPDNNFKLAIDNWFCCPILMHRLHCRVIQSIATYQINRFWGLIFMRRQRKENITERNLSRKTRFLRHDEAQCCQVVW